MQRLTENMPIINTTINNKVWASSETDITMFLAKIIEFITILKSNNKVIGSNKQLMERWNSDVVTNIFSNFNKDYVDHGGVVAKYFRATANDEDWGNIASKDGMVDLKKETLLNEQDWLSLKKIVLQPNPGDRNVTPVTEAEKESIRTTLDSLEGGTTGCSFINKHKDFILKRIFTNELIVQFNQLINPKPTIETKNKQYEQINCMMDIIEDLVVMESTHMAILQQDDKHCKTGKISAYDLKKTSALKGIEQLIKTLVDTSKDHQKTKLTQLQLELTKNISSFESSFITAGNILKINNLEQKNSNCSASPVIDKSHFSRQC